MITSRATLLVLLACGALARPEPPVQQYLPPSQSYGPPQNNPAGYPGHGSSGQFGGINQYLPPNQQYGPPGHGSGGYGDEAKYPPAHYSFEYMVKDQESHNDFGHKESRDGDMTRGWYYVLLPDGRRQTVEYEADEHGYRPKVTYTQEAYGGMNGYPPSNSGYHY